MSTVTTRPASAKQVLFIERLLNDKVVAPDYRAAIEGLLDTISMRDASAAIEFLMAQPRVPEVGAVEEPGIYEKDGTVYRVKRSGSGNLYATKLVEIGGTRITEVGEFINAEFEYAPGVVRNLRAADRMDKERAEALTIRYGFCVVCGRHLKDAKSVQRGMGPVCASRV